VLHVTDYDTGAPVRADGVTLTFAFRGRSAVQPSKLELARARDGSYVGTGANLALLGPWRVTALIRRGADPLEVAFAIATRVDEQKQVLPGEPVVTVVSLEGGRTVQFYIEGTGATRVDEQKQVLPGEPVVTVVSLEGGRTVQFYIEGTGATREVHATFLDKGGAEFRGLHEASIVGSRADGTIATLSVRELSPGHYVGDGSLSPGEWRFDASATTVDGTPLAGYFEQKI